MFATGRLLKKAPKLNSPTMDCAALGARLSSVLPKLGRLEAVILKFAKLQPVTDASMSYRAERGAPAPPRTKGRKIRDRFALPSIYDRVKTRQLETSHGADLFGDVERPNCPEER